MFILNFLLESGAVYTFGEGENGELGHGVETDHQKLYSPTKLQFPTEVHIKYAACGLNHVALISGNTGKYVYI